MMRYKQNLIILLAAFGFLFNSSCGPVDNFQNQRQVSLNTLALGGDYRVDNFTPNYEQTEVTSNVIQADFTENCDPFSLQTSFRLTETMSTGEVTDLTFNTMVQCVGPFATFTFTTPNAGGSGLAENARYELTIFQTARSAQNGNNLRFLTIYRMYSGFNFDLANGFGFTDPTSPPRVVEVNYYEICGQPYMFIFFNEDLARAPLVRVKTGLIGTFIGTGDPTYSTWPAYSGRMDVFGVHINSGGALSGHKIKIFKNDVVDLQGDPMANDYEEGGLFQLISPCF